MINSIETGDQYLDDLMIIGDTAKAFGLTIALRSTIKQYKIRKEELKDEELPWLQ